MSPAEAALQIPPPPTTAGAPNVAGITPQTQFSPADEDDSDLDSGGQPRRSPKRSRAQRALDLRTIAKWQAEGKHAKTIEDMLKAIRPYHIKLRQIELDLDEISRIWQAEAVASREKWVARELAGLNRQEEELWAAWDRSKEEARSSTVERGDPQPMPDGKSKATREKRKMTSEEQFGNPQYMRLILEVRDRRAKLLGLDKVDEAVTEHLKLYATTKDFNPVDAV